MKEPPIQFYRHTVDEECIALCSETARGLFITTGPRTAEFEKEFAAYLGLSSAIGLMSCTHALHLAYTGLGIGPGDEVIVPAFTFAATATAVLHAGARPVFADVDPHTGILDPDAAAAAITPRTKAISPVHMYGVMAPMDRFAELARANDLLLVEDAAHCVEGKGPGFSPGQLGDAVAFSFYATKNITCGEGGALATRHAALAEAAHSLRTHGMNRNAINRFTSRFAHYDIDRLGYKYNMTDLQAALLLPQLRKIEALRNRREEIARAYDAGLAGIPGIIPPRIPAGYISARHLYTIRVNDTARRDDFLMAMIDEGVNCAVHYRPLARLSFFSEKLGMRPEQFPNAAAIGDSTVTLPLYPALTGGEVERVIRTVREVAARILEA